MLSTIMITRFLGLVFAIYGLALLFHCNRVKSAFEQLSHDSTLSWAVGVRQLFWGTFLIVVQEVWNDWSIVTTLACWFVFIMGVSRLMMPACMTKCDGRTSKGSIAFLGLILLVWGLVMVYYGFFGSMQNMMSTMQNMGSMFNK